MPDLISPGGALAAMSVFQGLSGAYGSYMAGKASKAIGKANAYTANLAAEDAIRRGQMAEAQMRQRTGKVIGEQRAAMAAQGIRTDTGSAAEITNETADIGELDALTIKNNALKEAFGYKTNAISATMQGQLAGMSAQQEATQSLLTGGIRAYSYYKFPR